MLEFIQLLKQRYQSVIQPLDKKNPQHFDYLQRFEQLLYAEAFLRKGQLIEDNPNFPLQIAVIGPTQAGKSSIVNLLLNDELAGVSPLAGFTVHSQGFGLGVIGRDLEGLQHYFGRFQNLETAMLSRERYDCYSITLGSSQSDLIPPAIIWDTPDFDSIDAADYREGLVRTIALADLIVLVVSKEKYADQSVWDVMQTIAPFAQPTLIVLNKLAEDSEALVKESLKQKWRQIRMDETPPIISILFQKLPSLPTLPPIAKACMFEQARRVERKKHRWHQQQFLGQYWAKWLEPVNFEHQAQRDWQMLVDATLQQALINYRRDYLDHPHHYHTFQTALLNLLNLLEIPSLAKVLGVTRRAMTWPVRKLMNWGQGGAKANPDQEMTLLKQIGEHALIHLADKLLEKTATEQSQTQWWRETALALRQQRADLLELYQEAVGRYHQNFQHDIDAAAHRLYRKLQEQPVVLNSLRATRISTDAGAILLAIQAGGVGVHDLVITPLMLTLTSLLAESAIGSYMQRVETELKQRQLQTVKAQLFEGGLRDQLHQLSMHIHSPTRFNISESQCQQAEQALKEKKHGLRLL